MDEAFTALEDDRENWEAWQLFHRVFTRCSVDTHVASVLVARLLNERETNDAFDLMERFTLLYDILQPPPEKH